jgi:glutathione S-transferase
MLPSPAIPVLVDGDVTIFESNLILECLSRSYPGNAPGSLQPPLAPTVTQSEHHWEDE